MTRAPGGQVHGLLHASREKPRNERPSVTPILIFFLDADFFERLYAISYTNPQNRIFRSNRDASPERNYIYEFLLRGVFFCWCTCRKFYYLSEECYGRFFGYVPRNVVDAGIP